MKSEREDIAREVSFGFLECRRESWRFRYVGFWVPAHLPVRRSEAQYFRMRKLFGAYPSLSEGNFDPRFRGA